jgi:branched-chain amino acid transport system permease protein
MSFLILLIVLIFFGSIYLANPGGFKNFVQITINGILLGGLYGLIAVGIGIIMGVMKIINLNYGEFVILGSYGSYWLFTLFGLNPFVSIAFSGIVLFMIGLLTQRFLLNPVMKFGVNQPLLVSFGIMLCLQSIMAVLWTSDQRGIPSGYLGASFNIGGLFISAIRLEIFIFALAAVVFSYWFMKKTTFGLSLRITAQDMETASLMGVNVNRVNIISHGIGALFAGISGSLFALIFSFDPFSGPIYFLKGTAAVILGGVGSLPGALLGGILLGMSESIGSFFIGDGYRDAFAAILFVVILLLKPTGLLAKVRTW